ncbi:MAG: FapA family protein, partial [Treponema sp.]|nr:FapA family protein [Treponema sp.]
TICEVGFDPKMKEEMDQLILTRDRTMKQLDDIKLNMQTLINIKKQRKSLPEDKEAYLKELMDKRQVMIEDIRNAEAEIQKKQEYFDGNKSQARVSASAKVYPGVKILIRDVREDVRNEYRAVTFIAENSLIRVTKYEEPDEESKKAPDGYTTN